MQFIVKQALLRLTVAVAFFAATPSVLRAQGASPQAQLVLRPWRFIGDRWYAERVFNSDGTFRTIGVPKETGSWAAAADGITLTFTDGNDEVLSLPLNPAGTDGIDKNGHHFTAITGKSLPIGAASVLNSTAPLGSSSPLSSNTSLDSPSTTTTKVGRGGRQAFAAPTPDPFETLGPSTADQRKNAPSIALLTSAPWKIIGQDSVGTFDFDSTGTFSARDQTIGAWKISGEQLRLNFTNGITEILDLPLDPKGTDGSDSRGIPIIALQQPPGAQPAARRPARPAAALSNAAPTPANHAVAPAATAAPIPAKRGSVVPDHPFGTEQPRQQ